MITGQITISFSFLKLSCCSLRSSVTLIAHFCVLLILRCYGISYHHTIPPQPRTGGFGGEEQERQAEEEIQETKNSALFIIQTFPPGTNKSYAGNTNRKQRKIAWPTLMQHQLQRQKAEGGTESRNGLICESRRRINCTFLVFQKVAVWDGVTRGSVNWLVSFIFRQTSYSTSTSPTSSYSKLFPCKSCLLSPCQETSKPHSQTLPSV